MKTVQLNITGMTCSACSTRIEKSLRKLDGVDEASVQLALAQASVRLDPKRIPLEALKEAIERLGYGVNEERSTPKARADEETRSFRNRFLAALLLSIPLLWAMLSHLLDGAWLWTPSLFHEALFQWAVATALQFHVGFPFYYGAYKALRQGAANMDVLVALSTTVAYFYSHYQVLHPADHAGHAGHDGHIGHTMLYFDTIAMIMTAVLLGKWLESIAKGKALKDVSALYDLQVRLIRVDRPGGEAWIAAQELRKGDRVIVRAGEWISADGYVLSGGAEVDEAMLTGESRAIVKTVRDKVYSGTRCVNGSLVLTAETTTEGTRLSRIIALVEEAQSIKSRLARKVDVIAAYFVPAMIACALLTFLAWMFMLPAGDAFEPAMTRALAVLLVACPCALGLAAPVSILIATSQSAKAGILFKGGRALEQLYQIDCVLLDKTGTLTEGKPRLVSLEPYGQSANSVLRVAAAVEQHSKHPFAQAIIDAGRKHQLLYPEAAEVEEVPGCGMSALVEGQRIRIGHRSWLLAQGIPCGERDARQADPSAASGRTVLYAAADGACIGRLILADNLRGDAAQVVRELHRLGPVHMATGDQPEAARAIAAEAGIAHVHAGMSPERKLALVHALQDQGSKVALIGDGINDAAALAAADIGIAMGGGANAAIQAGDVVLVNDKLAGVTEAVAISRRTMGNIRQNLLLALCYNGITIPLAAGGFLDPKVACLGMALSSIAVVSNALRLQRRK